jgi:hypothetical protein
MEFDCHRRGYGSLFDGQISVSRDQYNYTFEGTSANIIENSSPICDTGIQDPNENFTFVWTMIHQNNAAPGGPNYGYAQVGYFRGWGQPCPYFATEQDDKYPDNFSRFIHSEYGCLQPNGVNQFWVQYIPSLNRGAGGLSMNVDTTMMNTTSWNPYEQWDLSAGPFLPEIAAETKYLGSSVPTTNFSSIQFQQSNDQWTTALLGLPDDLCPWPQKYIQGAFSNDFFAIQTSGTSDAYNC